MHCLLFSGMTHSCKSNVVVMVKYSFLRIIVEVHLTANQPISESPVTLSIGAVWSRLAVITYRRVYVTCIQYIVANWL